jgi:hypothetical protein
VKPAARLIFGGKSDAYDGRRNAYSITECNYRMNRSDFYSIGDNRVGEVKVIPVPN